jgi:ABC-type transporter Mla subunit MlaD
MRLPVPDPREVASLLPRVLRLVDEAEELLASVRALVARVESTRVAADDAVARIDATAARADALVVLVEPSVVSLVPVLEHVADTMTSPKIEAITQLLDTVPELARGVQDDVLPVLNSLSSVSPDLTELLAASRELNELLGGLPGMGRVRKRVEEAHQDDTGS